MVIHEPDKSVGYYGADVAGPVFKAIAQKMYTSKFSQTLVSASWVASADLESQYKGYKKAMQQSITKIPDLAGMAGMDAIALLENLGCKVAVVGSGKVVSQSLAYGFDIKKGTQISLVLSGS